MRNSRFSFILALSFFLVGTFSLVAQEATGKTPKLPSKHQKATFAGGCFWCMEPPFDKLPGVISTTSGYIGGEEKSPTYKQVAGGKTGHTEAVQVVYDPEQVSYSQLLSAYWRNINPTTANGQFVDKGRQYRPEIFYHSPEQQTAALASKKELQESGCFGDKKIVVPVTVASQFWPAEDYHQDYYKKNPIRYKFYRFNSGRDQYLKTVWLENGECKNKKAKVLSQYSKPSDEEIKKKLSPMQFRVTQKDATEPPFKNEYWDNKADGIYVDIVSGEPLFSSTDKYKSGTGWPSFVRPLEPTYIVEKDDFHLLYKRTEVRSKFGDSHLGHVFPDGPKPTGLRYCINSAALEFIPVAQLKSRGYEKYLALFAKK